MRSLDDIVAVAMERKQLAIDKIEHDKQLVFTHSKLQGYGVLFVEVLDFDYEKNMFKVTMLSGTEQFDEWADKEYFFIKSSIACFKPERAIFTAGLILADPYNAEQVGFDHEIMSELAGGRNYVMELRFKDADHTSNGYPALKLNSVKINHDGDEVRLYNLKR